MRRLIAGHARSGESVAGFARRHGISAETFYWWRSEIRRRDRASDPRHRVRTGFVEVSVAATTDLVLEVADGVRLRIGRAFDQDTLARVLEVLRSC